ncbi:MAG: recombination mediator RecR [Pseudomonadota bacterium]
MAAAEIERLNRSLAKLPGLGPRSAQRAALAMLKRPDSLLTPLVRALEECHRTIATCGQCGNLDSRDPCSVCADPKREQETICVVQEVDDLWAVERSSAFRGLYHVLGGTLSAFDGIGPEELGIDRLIERVQQSNIKEVILALSATVEGQTTAHYVGDRLRDHGCTISRLGHGVPIGGELNYLDDGTLDAALRARRPLG